MLSKKYKKFLQLNFYQIYPKSFKDENNDGVGDFRGIISKIPYLVSLGVNAVWLSPFFKSPNKDSGYDISDYFQVGKEYGNIRDFKKMVDVFHQNGIKVIIDLVVNHCSTEHFWFKEAKKGKDNPYRNYFYWFDQIPNSWQSTFGGSAYQYDKKSKQYYLHSFAKEQADLNWENPKVRNEVKKIIDYWVKLGVDGFRCDVLDMIAKDFKRGLIRNGPKLHSYLNEIFNRKTTKNLFTIGECWGANEDNLINLTASYRHELTASFIGGNITNHHRRFNLVNKLDYDSMHRYFVKYQTFTIKHDLVFIPFFENHDQSRSVSRFANDQKLRYQSATFFATLLYTLYGIPFILQGEEFGTPNAYYNSIKKFDDVETVNFYKTNRNKIPKKRLLHIINQDTRDNGRRPLVWNNSVNGGFNKGHQPWLPFHSRMKEINLEIDLKSKNSIFRYYQKLIAFRKKSKALLYGKFKDLTGSRKDLFMFLREYRNERIVVICNYDKESLITIPKNHKIIFNNYSSIGNKLKPFQAIVCKVLK